MESITDREYIKKVLIKNCGFEENRELEEKLQLDGETEICLDIPSAEEAVIFAIYTSYITSFLLNKDYSLTLYPLEQLEVKFCARESRSYFFISFNTNIKIQISIQNYIPKNKGRISRDF